MSPLSSDINARIAERVRSLRAEQDLSLDALATKSGVSRSMISLIERGESSPTAVVLERISAGLGVPLASLFEYSDAPASPLVREAERSSWKDPETGYVRRNISPPNFPAPFKIVEVTLPAGAHVAYDGSARDGTLHQQVWVREGTLELTGGSTRYTLHQGDCLAMQLEGPNSFCNRTKRPVRYVVVVTTSNFVSRGTRR